VQLHPVLKRLPLASGLLLLCRIKIVSCSQVHLAVTGRPDEMRVMWKTHSRSCPTKVHYGEGIMDEAGFDNAATLQNTLVRNKWQHQSHM
jgi:hypothetical protein